MSKREFFKGWLLSCTPFWLVSIGQIFFSAGSVGDFFNQYTILAGVVILIFSIWFSISMRLQEPRGSLVSDLIVGFLATVLISSGFTIMAFYSASLTSSLLGMSNGLVIGSPFLGSSEEIVYFLHPAGVLVGSLVLLVLNLAYIRH